MGAWCPAPVGGPAGRRAPRSSRPPDRPGRTPLPPAHPGWSRMSSTTARSRPAADPYADTDVIDARAPRFLQATVGVGAVTALVTGWWWLYGLLALQLVVGLVLGRRWCLPCVAYFELVQPRVGEGRVEDARPPRFANKIGATVLGLAFAAHLAGLPAAGTALGAVVAVLAVLAATTGLCVGCELYKLGARLRGVRPGAVGVLDLAEVGAAPGRPWSSSPTRCAATAGSWRSAWPPRPRRCTPWTCPAGPTWPAATTWSWCRPPSGSPATGRCWSAWPSPAPGRPWPAGAGSRSRPLRRCAPRPPRPGQPPPASRPPAHATGRSGSRRPPRPSRRGPPAVRGQPRRPAPGPGRPGRVPPRSGTPGRRGAPPGAGCRPPAASPRAGRSPWRRCT